MNEIWNGPAAQAIRQSILDGSFRHCTSLCPWLKTESGPVQRAKEVVDPRFRRVIRARSTVLPHGPLYINAAFDKSCNLRCPSCRTGLIIERTQKEAIGTLTRKVEAEAGADAELLYITGSGDAFGSPYLSSWLRDFQPALFPHLKSIHLHTNGQLWSPRVWGRLRPEVRALIKSAEVSVDAATARSYALNRRGGRWDRLQRNLAFIAELRARGPLEYWKIHMVVQRNNYREMARFVALGKKLAVDSVYFSRLTNWGTFSPAELQRRSVHDPKHPNHRDLLRRLSDPIFEDPIVNLGNLSDLRAGRRRSKDPSERSEIARMVERLI